MGIIKKLLQFPGLVRAAARTGQPHLIPGYLEELAGLFLEPNLELDSGRWILSCHYIDHDFGYRVQRLWYSDDTGSSWQGPVRRV